MTDDITQRVSIQDANGKYGRLRFSVLFKSNEWAALRGIAKTTLGDEIVEAVDRLPRHKTHNDAHGAIGWWLPGDFQANPCEMEIPQETSCTIEGFGWDDALVLRKKNKQVLAFIDAYADQNEIGQRRKEQREYHEEFPQYAPSGGFRLFTPFEGTGAIKRMLDPAASITVESPEEFLEVGSAVIYSGDADAYLTPQSMWKGLNRARLFVSAEEAGEYIKSNKLARCTVAVVRTRVEMFVNPDQLGAKARRAMSHRQAQEMSEALEDTPAAIQSPRRRI